MKVTTFTAAAGATIAALCAVQTVQAGVLGRFELAQPLVDENMIYAARSEQQQQQQQVSRARPGQAQDARLADSLAQRAAVLADPALGNMKSSTAAEKRVVGTVRCNGFARNGVLQLVSTSTGRARNAAFEGVRNAEKQNQLDLGHATTDAPAQRFNFHACNSGFMDWHQQTNGSTTVWYGHLRWDRSPRHCVAAADLAVASTHVVNEMCSYSDDSSQLFQYWSLTRQTNATTKQEQWFVDFIGEPKQDPEGDFSGKYLLGRETPEANGQGTHFVTIKRSKDETATSPYRLQLV